MKILVVDDEKAICAILEEFLSIFGHTVQSANSGENALERLRETVFDVVFLDIRMPGISGLEVLKEVKASRPATKVIMISAYGDDETAQKARELGADGYVQKPVDLPGLLLLLKDGGRP
jgi:CheY-like chemotaxis protein